MPRKHLLCLGLTLAALLCFALPAGAQNFMVQCPQATLFHPTPTTTVGGPGLYNDYNATGVTVPYATQSSVPTLPNNYGAHYENYYTGPVLQNVNTGGVPLTYVSDGGTVKCQQISGGDGYMTEADGNQTFMFSFGPLSGLDKIQNGVAGTDFPDEFDQSYCDPNKPNYTNGQPNPYINGGQNPLSTTQTNIACSQNGAVGFVPSATARTAIGQSMLTGNALTSTTATGVAAVIVEAPAADFPNVTPGAGYTAPPSVTFASPAGQSACTAANTIVPTAANPLLNNPLVTGPCVQATGTATIGQGAVIEVAVMNPGNGYLNAPNVTFSAPSTSNPTPNTDPAAIMNTAVINGNIPAPEIAFDEDDELFLTLTNVGMIMRPDLFEQHTVHFHGYPNAASFYDGVPDASLAINIGASFSYYYLAPDAGTYFWHCHITPPEHLQMGMVGQLFVRPRQNRLPPGVDVYNTVTGSGKLGATTNGAFGTPTGLSQQSDLRTACNTGEGTNTAGQSNLYAGTAGSTAAPDILCSVPSPAADTGFVHQAGYKYVYNDGDGSTRYDVDVPIQMHGFDPNFHFVGMTFNPEGFADMKDKYFLLNGRSYPDTVGVVQASTVAVGGYVPAGETAHPCAQSTSSAGTNPYAIPCTIPIPTTWSGGIPSAAAATNPDPVSNAIMTQGSDANQRPEQPMPSLVVLSQTGSVDGAGNATPQRAALRLVNLSVTEYHTLASLSIPLHVVGWNAKMLRDEAGNNLGYYTNSVTIGGGESMDAILDACAVRTGPPNYTCTTPVPTGTYFIYSPNLDHLSNDAENFGGMMTEVIVTP
jgi:hypothetical protein